MAEIQDRAANRGSVNTGPEETVPLLPAGDEPAPPAGKPELLKLLAKGEDAPGDAASPPAYEAAYAEIATQSAQSAHSGFVGVSAGDNVSWLLRADGAVDATSRGRLLKSTLYPPHGVRYVQVAAGAHNSYALRSDGAVDRVTSACCWQARVASTINPPVGRRYVGVSCGQVASYFLRDDGAVDRTKGYGVVSKTINPPPGKRYVAVFAGTQCSYFARSDGLIDRTAVAGVVNATIEPAGGGGGRFRVVGAPSKADVANGDDSGVVRTGDTNDAQEGVACFPRDDGGVDRVWCSRLFTTTLPPPEKTRYIVAASANCTFYLVRADGAVDRVGSYGKVLGTICPPDGVKYVGASAGRCASYLLRSDGKVDRTTGRGRVGATLEVPVLKIPDFVA